MDRQQNLKKLVKDLSAENEELKKYVVSLQEELSVYTEKYGDNWIYAKEYTDAVKEVKKIQKEYIKATNEVVKLKAEYEAKLDEMMEKYSFKE